MKTTIFLCAIIFLFIAGCNEHNANPTTHQHDSTSQKTEQTAIKSEPSLTLNEGKKWKLDESTHANINATKAIFEKSAKEPGQDYAVLASKLQEAANKLVSECKMSGKDHDMLHIWLEKYLSTLKELKAPEAETQKAAFNKIGEQLKNFDQYFE